MQTVWRFAKKVLPIAVLALILVACGSSEGLVRQEAGVAVRQGSEVDWDHPLGIEAERLASAAEAQKRLPFEIVVPSGLGEPVAIDITPPAVTPPDARVVAFIYDTVDYGRVVVKEGFPDVPPADYEETLSLVVEHSQEPDVEGTAEKLEIRGGKPAVVTTVEDGSRSSMAWLEGEIEITVRGPDIDREQVLAIGEAL